MARHKASLVDVLPVTPKERDTPNDIEERLADLSATLWDEDDPQNTGAMLREAAQTIAALRAENARARELLRDSWQQANRELRGRIDRFLLDHPVQPKEEGAARRCMDCHNKQHPERHKDHDTACECWCWLGQDTEKAGAGTLRHDCGGKCHCHDTDGVMFCSTCCAAYPNVTADDPHRLAPAQHPARPATRLCDKCLYRPALLPRWRDPLGLLCDECARPVQADVSQTCRCETCYGKGMKMTERTGSGYGPCPSCNGTGNAEKS